MAWGRDRICGTHAKRLNHVNKIKVALGSGFFVAFFVQNGLAAIAIPYYQMVLAVDPFLLGCLFTLPVLLSAFLSPTIGRLIDRHFATARLRANLIGITGWIAAMAFGAIWMAPSHWPHHIILWYLLVSTSLFFLTATVLSIAIKTLAFRSIADHSEINGVMSYTNIFEKLGSLIYFWAFPLAQSTFFSSTITGVRFVGWTIAIGFIGILSSVTRYFSQNLTTGLIPKAADSPTIIPKSKSTYDLTLYLILAMTFIQFGLIGTAVFFDFYLIVYHMFAGDVAQGAFWKGVVSTAYAAVGLATIPILKRLADRYGKVNTLLMVYVLNTVNGLLKWWLFQPQMEYFLILDAVFGAWVWTAMGVLIPGLLMDICVQNKAKTGDAAEAYVISRHTQGLNLGLVVAFLASGLLLKTTGFDANLGAGQLQASLDWMAVILAGGSASMSIVILFLLMWLKRHLKLELQKTY